MDNRDTILSAQFPQSIAVVQFVELDLRDLSANVLIGRRGQLQFTTKLVFKAGDVFRQDQSVFQFWADVRVAGQDGAPLPNLGRATIPEPVFFTPLPPDNPVPVRHDPWTRANDHLMLVVDFRQLDEIEHKRRGGSLTFTVTVGGVVYHGGRIATLHPSNHQLTYEVSASTWLQLLNQLGYGTYMNIEIPITGLASLTGAPHAAVQALQEALIAFRRGDYEEAVADCRPGLEALEQADKGKFSTKPWERTASKEERIYWLQRSLLSLTHVAHHPNDPALARVNSAPGLPQWERTDAEFAISTLAALIRQRAA